MVGAVVNGVHPNSINIEFLELGDVAVAAIFIGDGIGKLRRSTGLIVEASNVKAVAIRKESYVIVRRTRQDLLKAERAYHCPGLRLGANCCPWGAPEQYRRELNQQPRPR